MGKLARQNVIKGLHYYREAPFYISEGLAKLVLICVSAAGLKSRSTTLPSVQSSTFPSHCTAAKGAPST